MGLKKKFKMKTRIKIIEKNNGDKIYIPQYRRYINPILRVVIFPFQILLAILAYSLTGELDWPYVAKWETMSVCFWKTKDQVLIGDGDPMQTNDIAVAKNYVYTFVRMKSAEKIAKQKAKEEACSGKVKRTTYIKYP